MITIKANRSTLTGTTNEGREVYFSQSTWRWFYVDTDEKVRVQTSVVWVS